MGCFQPDVHTNNSTQTNFILPISSISQCAFVLSLKFSFFTYTHTIDTQNKAKNKFTRSKISLKNKRVFPSLRIKNKTISKKKNIFTTNTTSRGRGSDRLHYSLKKITLKHNPTTLNKVFEQTIERTYTHKSDSAVVALSLKF